MKHKLAVLLWCVSLSLADSNLDDAVDKVLEQLGAAHKGDGKVIVPHKGSSFEKRVGPIVWSYDVSMRVTPSYATIRITDSLPQNIEISSFYQTMRRKGEALKFVDPSGGRTLKFNMLIGPITFTATGVVNVIGIGGRYDWQGRVAFIEATVAIVYSKGRDDLRVGYVIVENVAGLSASVERQGINLPIVATIRNALLQQTARIFSGAFREPIAQVLESELTQRVGTDKAFDAIKEVLKQ